MYIFITYICVLFQDYEIRLFRFDKTSAEEAVDLRKKNSELNRFYSKLSLQNKNRTATGDGNQETGKRVVGERVVVSCFFPGCQNKIRFLIYLLFVFGAIFHGAIVGLWQFSCGLIVLFAFL